MGLCLSSFPLEMLLVLGTIQSKDLGILLTMNISVFYIQYLLKWIPADLYYQMKISMNERGEREEFTGLCKDLYVRKIDNY